MSLSKMCVEVKEVNKEVPDYERRFGELLEKYIEWECEKEEAARKMTKEEFHELIMRAEEMKKNGIEI